MKYFLRAHIRVAGQDLHVHIKRLHWRPYVIGLFINELIDRGHEAFKNSGPAAELKIQMQALIEERYPETEAENHSSTDGVAYHKALKKS